MRTTTFLFVAVVLALAVEMNTRAFAQDVRGPGLKTAHATLYTSPVHVSGDISCNVLNTTSQPLQVEMHLVYSDGLLVDDTSLTSTPTVSAKSTASIGGSVQAQPNALLYCRFSFAGPKNQVRAMMMAKSGDIAISSEAR